MMDEQFWQALDKLVEACEIVLDRPKGTRHPRYPNIVYPLDYGYLAGSTSGDGDGIDVWVGSLPDRRIVGVEATVDMEKRDAEIKVLIGLTDDEMATVSEFHNEWPMSAVIIKRTEWTTMQERACAIVIEEGRILLMHRGKAGIEYYTVPGGKIEPGETPEEACLREVLEETGITVEITSEFAVLSNLGRVEHYFLVKKLSGDLQLGGPEAERQSEANFYEPMWVPLDRLSEYRLLPEEIKEMIIQISPGN